MRASNRQLTRQEVQKLAKDLPCLCLQGPVPTHTVMSMALEITTLLAERDEARSCAAEMRDSLHDAQPSIEEGPSEWMPLTWERATPTEGECSECGATSGERGLLPCDMPGCPRATPTEGDR